MSDLVMSDLRLPGKPRKNKSQNLNIPKSAIPKRGAKISIFGFRQSHFQFYSGAIKISSTILRAGLFICP